MTYIVSLDALCCIALLTEESHSIGLFCQTLFCRIPCLPQTSSPLCSTDFCENLAGGRKNGKAFTRKERGARKDVVRQVVVYLLFSACLPLCWHFWQGDEISGLTHTYMHAYMHAHTCMHAYRNTYMHACMYVCMRTYIQKYIHTCMHACIHT